MSPRAFRVLAIVLFVVGAPAAFCGVCLLALNVVTAPWIGSVSASGWTALAFGVALLVGGALSLRRSLR
jgi:hypothetical protein